MADIKINKEILTQLTGSIDKSKFEGKKKLLSLFDLIDNCTKNNTIDIKEITNFANSVFTADTNKDNTVDKKELEAFIKNNKEQFEAAKIKAKDILEFFNVFLNSADKTDEKSQRINNPDGSYSLIYEEINSAPYYLRQKDTIIKRINYDNNNNIITTEITEGNTRTIQDKNGRILTTQQLDGDRVVSELKADHKTYYYDGNKTTIKNQLDEIQFEIETLESGKRIVKEYKEIAENKIAVITTNEETGKQSQEIIYEDYYKIYKNEYQIIELRDLKQAINNPIDADNYHTINYMGKNIIKSIAKEEDKNFQKTYITGMVNKIIELAELVEINSDEIKAIKKEIETNGFEKVSIDSINETYSKLFEKIAKKSPIISSSKISNKYYKSENSYTKVEIKDKIIIIDSQNNKTTIDKNKLLRVYSQRDRNVMWDVIKTLPVETLIDLSIEVSFSNHQESKGAAASYNIILDKVNVGDIVRETDIIHELGHAIDHLGNGGYDRYQSINNEKFKQAFKVGMEKFLKAGNKRCTQYFNAKNNEYITKNTSLLNSNTKNDSTYATLNEAEMFAECYTLIMLGTCDSEEVITTYFKEALDCVLEILKSTRELPNVKRH